MKNKLKTELIFIIVVLCVVNLVLLNNIVNLKQNFYEIVLKKECEIVGLEVEIDELIEQNIGLSSLNKMLIDLDSNYYQFDGGYFDENDVTKTSGMTELMAENMLRLGLKGLGKDFIEVEREYGINARFMISVARMESRNGQYKYMDRNNILSLGAYTNNPDNAFAFDTVRGSIEYFARLINKDYIDKKGFKSVEDIGSMYAFDPEWANNINRIARMKNK